MPLGELEIIGAPLLGNEIEQGGVPRHPPAVEPKRWSVEGETGHAFGVPCSVMNSQNRSHRKAAYDDGLASGRQAIVLFLYGLVPILPARGAKVVGGAAMASELRHVHRVAGVAQALSDIAHLHGRPAEAVDEEEANG